MIPSEQILIAFIGMIGTSVAGLYALFKYFVKQMAESQNKFIDYIEKKNGHMERTSQLFTQEMANTTEMFGKKFDRLAEILLDIKRGQ